MFICYQCDEYFAGKRNYLSHETYEHNRNYCAECNLLVENMNEHKVLCGENDFKFTGKICTLSEQYGRNKINYGEIILKKKAFNGYLSQWELINRSDILDVQNFFGFYQDDIKSFIRKQLKKLVALKIQFKLQVLFNRLDNDLIVENIGYFSTKTRYLSNIKLWPVLLSKLVNQLENQLLEYSINGSNWIVRKIIRLDLYIGKYNANYGSCPKTELPPRLKAKNALICVLNKDDKCFLYSICAKLFPTTKRYQQARPQYYVEYLKKFNLKNIKFPFDIRFLKRFEAQNKHLDMRINIYGYNQLNYANPNIFPVIISKTKAKNTIDLLLYEEHFYLIKNFNRFCGRKGISSHHFCRNCLIGYRTKSQLNKHEEDCSINSPTKIIMPIENDSMKFSNHENKLREEKI